MKEPAFIFDFDGTILDSEVSLFRIWRDVFLDEGEDLKLEDWVTYVGAANDAFDPFRDLQERVSKPLDRGTIEAKARQAYYDYCDAQFPLPGVAALMKRIEAENYSRALASSAERFWLKRHLDRLELTSFFHSVLGREDVTEAKPSPEIFLKSAEALGRRPQDCIVIEDSLHGLTAAKAAGMYCIVVPHELTSHLDLSAADQCLTSLEEIEWKFS